MRLGIYDEKLKFNPELETNCLLNTVMQILSYYRVKHPFQYIDSSLHLIYDNAKERICQNSNDYMFPELSNRVPLHSQGNLPWDEIWQMNQEKIKQQIPLIMYVDLYYLKHTTYHKIYHCSHTLLLCGYSEDGKQALISDCFKWIYKGDVNVDDLKEARMSLNPKDDGPFSGIPIECKWREFPDYDLPNDLEGYIKKTVDQTIQQYYPSSMGKADTMVFGIHVLYMVYESLVSLKNDTIECKIKLMRDVRILFLRVYSDLRLMKYFFDETYFSVKSERIDVLLKDIMQELPQWDYILSIMTRSIYKRSDEDYAMIIINFQNLIRKQEERHELFVKLNESL